MREINIRAIYDCYLDIYFNYKLKCNPNDEIEFNKELDYYEESNIWKHTFFRRTYIRRNLFFRRNRGYFNRYILW